MKMAAIFIILVALSGLPVLSADEVTECDLQAAHPSDPDHVGPAVKTNEMVTHLAIPACRAAITAQPEIPRFHYQLGRAIVYWAGANDADYSEGMEHLKHASDMNYTQAMFVLGLMQMRHGDNCSAEPLTRAAADQGLKSARISYVNNVLGGIWSDCNLSVTKDEMSAYLNAASEQVSGWYENMLLSALKRELDAYKSGE